MEKRLILAIALSVLVLVAWNYIYPPPAPPQTPAVAEGTLADAGEPGTPELRGPEERPSPDPVTDATEPPRETNEIVQADAAEEIKIANGPFEVVMTNIGGRAVSWKLVDYPDADGTPLELLPPYRETDLFPLALELDDRNLTADVNAALYKVERTTLGPSGGVAGGERIEFVWADARGIEARKAFTFRNGDYLVDVDVEVTDRGRRLPVRLTVGPGLAAQESREGRSNYYYEGQLLWDDRGEVTRKKRSKIDDAGAFPGLVRWAGLEDQFFTAVVLPGPSGGELTWRKVQRTPVAAEAEPESQPIVAVEVGDGAQIFVGPKQYKKLRALGHDLEKTVWFSSVGWLAVIVKYIYLSLLWLHDHVTGNYGLAIILATVVLRLALFPLNQYSMVSMKKSQLQMQRLQPKIKSIRNKYRKQKDAESRGRMNQEMMDLYKREGVNPMGGVTGCLPMLAQFPILIGFYNMLTVAVELRGAPFFGWIQDLSVKDPFFVTPLLMGGTMFLQQKMAMSKVTDPQQMQQQRIMMFMPFMFTFICLQMPAGLVLYWFVNNLLGIGQQWLVNKHTSKLELDTPTRTRDAARREKRPKSGTGAA